MIAAYHRPQQLKEALSLLAREEHRTIVLAGGLAVNQGGAPADAEVVDIQSLELGGISSRGKTLRIGAAATLQSLLESAETPPALKEAVRRQDAYNRRQMATAAGAVLAGDGRSPFAAALYALDPILVIAEQGRDPAKRHLGDIYALGQEELRGQLITEILVPGQAALAYHAVARSPADRPLVCAAAARWPSGRTRVVLGGTGSRPVLVLDGPTPDGATAAARDAYRDAGDAWASAEYRSDAAGVLVDRCLADIKAETMGGAA